MALNVIYLQHTFSLRSQGITFKRQGEDCNTRGQEGLGQKCPGHKSCTAELTADGCLHKVITPGTIPAWTEDGLPGLTSYEDTGG